MSIQFAKRQRGVLRLKERNKRYRLLLAGNTIFSAALTSSLLADRRGSDVYVDFTRTSAATITDFEGSVPDVLDEESRFWYARRVENLADSTDAPVTQNITVVVGTEYIVSCATGDLSVSGAFTGSITGGGEIAKTAATTTTLTVTITTATKLQVEKVSGTQTLASEYVSRGV